MEWRQTYNDLTEEISALEHRATELSDQLELAYQMCYDGKMPGDSFSRIPLDKALETYDSVKLKLQQVTGWLERKREAQADMEKCLDRMESLENKVAYRRAAMRQSYRQIAVDLGYTEGYVRNVHYRIMKEDDHMDMKNVTFL